MHSEQCDEMLDLFEPDVLTETSSEALAPGTVVLRGFALPQQSELLDALQEVIALAPLRHMVTPGGYRMSVAMTNCGEYGWVTDRSGYRYDTVDPLTARRWPTLPEPFASLAADAASAAGFVDFIPDACLINRYEPGSRLSLHQDRNERDFSAPIVSVSLGIPAIFLFGGEHRGERPQRVPLAHGDVVVWGGPARLRFHGVLPLKENRHPLLERCRFNLTLRKAAPSPLPCGERKSRSAERPQPHQK